MGEVTMISSLTVNDSLNVHNFVLSALKDAAPDDKIVIDLDATDNGVLSLALAMHIRLSVADIKELAFLPILLVSYFPLTSFLKLGEYSQFFLSRLGYAFCSPDEVPVAVNNIEPLTADSYNSCFLDCVQIHPDATVGRHSMANQWGADVLYRLLGGNAVATNENIRKEKTKLYYKYIYLKTTGVACVLRGGQTDENKAKSMLNAVGKKILLIDDEAQKGWADVLRKWLFGASIDVIDREVSTYEELPEDVRAKISSDYYDLYLLDLRLLGNKEDDIYDAEEFSGMKILRRIKVINRGNQVIMMTASNKAWNMKALLDAGADGYYIKESPELQLPKSFSENNFGAFKKEVLLSLSDRAYKKNVYRNVIKLVNDIRDSEKFSGDFEADMTTTLESSLNQVMTADSPKDFAFAFVTLFQALEHICQHYVSGEQGCWVVNGVEPLCYYNIKCKYALRQGEITKDYPSVKDRLIAISYVVCGFHESRFLKDVEMAVSRRNAFVHNDNEKLKNEELDKIHTAEGYRQLLKVVNEIVCGLIESKA